MWKYLQVFSCPCQCQPGITQGTVILTVNSYSYMTGYFKPIYSYITCHSKVFRLNQLHEFIENPLYNWLNAKCAFVFSCMSYTKCQSVTAILMWQNRLRQYFSSKYSLVLSVLFHLNIPLFCHLGNILYEQPQFYTCNW